MRIWVGVMCVVAAACGGVDTAKKDAAVDVDASGTDSPMIDARMIDANNCMLDTFDGSTLNSHWAVVAGAAPTYTVANGKITITDAPLATTPSNTSESWINDYATDLGNQLGWAHAIGGGDFVVTADFEFASSTSELQYTGLAVTDGTNHIVGFAGYVDGGQGFLGVPTGAIAGIGTMTQAVAASGSLSLRIERTSSMMKVTVNGVELAAGVNNTPLSYVSMVAVPYRLNANNYPFGTAEFGSVQVCR